MTRLITTKEELLNMWSDPAFLNGFHSDKPLEDNQIGWYQAEPVYLADSLIIELQEFGLKMRKEWEIIGEILSEHIRIFLKALEELMLAIAKAFQPVFEKIIEYCSNLLEEFRRETLGYHLLNFGIPYKYTRWLVDHWPRRLLPSLNMLLNFDSTIFVRIRNKI